MKTFNIYSAFIAVLQENADDVRPVGIAESRRAVPRELVFTLDAVFANDIPRDCRVLAVDIEDLRGPFPELRLDVNQLDKLVAWFLLEAGVVYAL